MSPVLKNQDGVYFYNMCGRYTLVSKIEVIEKRFQAKANFSQYSNPNISAADLAPVITSGNPQTICLMHFGMQPPWATKSMLLLNARSEGDHNPENSTLYHGALGIIQKPAFRKPIRQQRCLVLADAFIEGPEAQRLQQPYLVYPNERESPFAFAGIWECWQDLKSGEIRNGFAIITGPAMPVVASFNHHRSPIVLPQGEEHTWLDPDLPLAEVTALLKAPAELHWNTYPISTAIKQAANKSLDLLQPVGPPLLPELSFVFSQKLQLSGMGASPARNRRAADNDQLSLF
jgi:putative SOS response-associated peptidase YedK